MEEPPNGVILLSDDATGIAFGVIPRPGVISTDVEKKHGLRCAAPPHALKQDKILVKVKN